MAHRFRDYSDHQLEREIAVTARQLDILVADLEAAIEEQERRDRAPGFVLSAMARELIETRVTVEAIQ